MTTPTTMDGTSIIIVGVSNGDRDDYYNPAQSALLAERSDLLAKAESARSQYYSALMRVDQVAKHLLNAVHADEAGLAQIIAQLGVSNSSGYSLRPYYAPYAYDPYHAPPPAPGLGGLLGQFVH